LFRRCILSAGARGLWYALQFMRVNMAPHSAGVELRRWGRAVKTRNATSVVYATHTADGHATALPQQGGSRCTVGGATNRDDNPVRTTRSAWSQLHCIGTYGQPLLVYDANTTSRTRSGELRQDATRGVDYGCGGQLTPWKYVGGVRVCLDLPKCHILLFKSVVG